MFDTALHKSLWVLDQAKQQWAAANNKSRRDIPTWMDLAPYLGNSTNAFKQLMELGINYKITSPEEAQCDVATLTHDVYFLSGPRRFYPAGTKYCIQTGWFHPHLASFRAFLIDHDFSRLFDMALLILVVGNVAVFLMKERRGPAQPSPR
jgi:hypothetical protein